MPSIKLTVVAEKLFMDDNLSINGLKLLAALVSNSEKGMISKRQAALVGAEKNLHKDQIKDALEELSELEYICYSSNSALESDKRSWEVRP
jgi:hypothetical protein